MFNRSALTHINTLDDGAWPQRIFLRASWVWRALAVDLDQHPDPKPR